MMITAHKNKNFSVRLEGKNHSLISDVSKDLGGDDTGLNPHEILEAALAACTSITVSMYAKHKLWPLEDIEVKVQIVKEGAESTISREVSFIGELDKTQRERLLDIANKCPIHKLLSSKISIETRVL